MLGDPDLGLLSSTLDDMPESYYLLSYLVFVWFTEYWAVDHRALETNPVRGIIGLPALRCGVWTRREQVEIVLR